MTTTTERLHDSRQVLQAKAVVAVDVCGRRLSIEPSGSRFALQAQQAQPLLADLLLALLHERVAARHGQVVNKLVVARVFIADARGELCEQLRFAQLPSSECTRWHGLGGGVGRRARREAPPLVEALPSLQNPGEVQTIDFYEYHVLRRIFFVERFIEPLAKSLY